MIEAIVQQLFLLFIASACVCRGWIVKRLIFEARAAD